MTRRLLSDNTCRPARMQGARSGAAAAHLWSCFLMNKDKFMPLGGGHILRDRRPMADACATIAQNQSAARIVMDAGATRFVRQWPGSANGKESVICRRLQVPVHGSADRQAGALMGRAPRSTLRAFPPWQAGNGAARIRCVRPCAGPRSDRHRRAGSTGHAAATRSTVPAR